MSVPLTLYDLLTKKDPKSEFYKTLILLFISQSLVTATEKPIISNMGDHYEFDCDVILPSMNFLHNQHCVQFIFGYDLYPSKCVRTIVENSVNVTFYMRSLCWLLNRNVYVEETAKNIMLKKSTKYCENFLIVLKDTESMQRVLKSLNFNASVKTVFPYTKLYFMLVEKTTQSMPTEMFNEIKKILYENAQFGYLYEFNANTSTVQLHNFLSFTDILPFRTNLNHAFVDRTNKEKEFRMSFYDCPPYVIYDNEGSLR